MTEAALKEEVEEKEIPQVEEKVAVKEVEEPAPKKSLKEELRENFKTIKERNNDKESLAKDGSEPERVVEKRKPVTDNEGNVSTRPNAKPAAEEKPLDPPISWRKEAKEKFKLAPREVQEEALRRDKEAEQKISTMDEERQFARKMKDVITPYTPIITAANTTPEKAVGEMLNYAHILQTGSPQQKGLLLHQLAQRWGADMRFTPQAATQPQNQIGLLQSELQKTKDELARLPETLKQQQETVQLKQVIDAFASDPKNVHYEKVKPVMAALLTAGNATDMKDAYEKACYADPDVRSSMLADKQKADEKRIADEKKAKAVAARNAASSLKGSPGLNGADNPTKQKRSLREELQANFRAVTQN